MKLLVGAASHSEQTLHDFKEYLQVLEVLSNKQTLQAVNWTLQIIPHLSQSLRIKHSNYWGSTYFLHEIDLDLLLLYSKAEYQAQLLSIHQI